MLKTSVTKTGLSQTCDLAKRAELRSPHLAEFLSIYDSIHLPTFLLKVEPEQRITFVGLNKTHEAQTGLSTHELEGKTPHEIFPARLADTLLQNYQTCVQMDAPHRYEEVLSFPSGEIWWDTTLSPIREEGQIVGIIGVAIDISRHKKTEQRLASALQNLTSAKNSLEVFASSTAHDLRGPLRQALMINEMILEDFEDLGNHKLELLRTQQGIFARALDFIDDKLRTARQDFALEPEAKTIDFGHWCRDIVALLDPLGNVDVSYEACHVETEVFNLDIGLRNLIDNAIKHANSRVVISISAEKTPGKLCARVSDDGRGMSGDMLTGEKQESDCANPSPSGFGLKATRRLAVSHGGDVRLEEPSLGRGTTIAMVFNGHISRG